jgi:FixJ family two-component response regulator
MRRRLDVHLSPLTRHFTKNVKDTVHQMVRSAQQSLLISIIDDDESVRAATTSLVRSVGFDASTFASAEEFLRSPALRHTACLISDVQMPGMSGLELQIAMTAQNIHAPIILITAFPDPRIREKALNAGAICFLKKPFDGRALLKCIERALARPAT